MVLISSLARLLDIVLPRRCVACGRPTGCASWLCSSCWEEIATIGESACPRCSLPFPSDAALIASPSHLCGRCRAGVYHFGKVYAAGRYENVLREAVHAYKYHAKVGLGAELAGLVIDRLGEVLLGGGYDVLVHVPMHKRRVRQREFDHSMLLARELSARLGIPHVAYALERVRATPPQIGLKGAERLRNVRGAFKISTPEVVKDRRILLFDDVMTSGATANECTRVLLRTGASEVDVLVVARAARG